MKINWKVRFNKKNIQFIFRFIAALLIPIMAYLGYRLDDIVTWSLVKEVFIEFISNPFLIGLTLYNAMNIIPDPTQGKLRDSNRALSYLEPYNDDHYI